MTRIYPRATGLRLFTGIGVLVFAAVFFGPTPSRAADDDTAKVTLRTAVLPLRVEPERLDRRAFHFYSAGLIYEADGDLRNAMIAYRKALEYFPESHEIAYSLANVLYRVGRPQEALDYLLPKTPRTEDQLMLIGACYQALGDEVGTRTAFLEVFHLDSNNTRALSYLAGAYRSMRNVDSAAWAYEQLVRLRPENYRLLNDLSRLKLGQGDIEGAKADLQQSLELVSDPTNVLAMLRLGELYEMQEQPDSAEAMYLWADETEPGNVVANRQLARLYTERDDLASALPHARAVVEESPLDRVAQRRLGMIYFAMDSLDVADSIFTNLVENGDRNPLNHSALGRIAGIKEDWQRAVTEFGLVVQMADSIPDGWLNLGVTYRQLGNRNQEIYTYQAGLNHMRDDAGTIRLLFALAAAYEQDGQIEKSVSTFEEVLAISPDHSPSLNYLGYMLADRNERLDYAKDLIERANDLVPDNAAYLDSYGWVHYRLGDYDRAIELLQRAVSLDTDPIMFDHLGDAYNAIGKVEEARVWWEKALELEPENDTIREKLTR